MRQLKINIDNDNRPLIENGKLYDQSLLSTQYKQAFGAIESVLRAQMQLKNSSFSDDDVEYPNNIIVFDGERGTGKTSCMLSVSQMLLEDGNEPYHDNLLLSETRFARLPMLEPSFFDNEHNVLNLIVSRLYKKYTGLENVSADKRRSILELFSKVQNNLKCMFGKSEKQDALEYLVNLSAAIELKKNLKDLIDIYLGVVGGKPDKLLILIDDIDLNHSQADRMVEEIRKYLILDNCIVLVSVKIEQLSGILFRKYEDEYKDKLLTDEIQIEIQDRVERYLSKLFPQRQRVFMPLPDDYLKSKLIVESSKKLDYKLVDGDCRRIDSRPDFCKDALSLLQYAQGCESYSSSES